MAEQFRQFVVNAVSGRLGDSFVFRRPVTDLIFERLPATLELALAAFVIAVAVGIPLGMVAGAKPQSRAARAIMGLSVVRFLETFDVDVDPN